MAGNENNEAESQLSGVSAITVPDDIFLSIQRATSALSKIYTELLSNQRTNSCQSYQTTATLKN